MSTEPDTGAHANRRTHHVMIETPEGVSREWCSTEDLMHAEEECLALRREGQIAWVEPK